MKMLKSTQNTDPMGRMIIFCFWVGLSLFLATLWQPTLLAQAPEWNDPKLKAAYKIPLQAYAFDLKQVRLLDGPFKRAMELDHQYLLELDADRLLHAFRINAGLTDTKRH